MYAKATIICCLTALLLSASAHQPVQSQPATEEAAELPNQREKLLQEWAALQENAVAGTDFITFTRTIEQTIDSPHGRDQTRKVAEVFGRPNSKFWVDHIVSASVNGRTVEEEQLARHKQRWRPGLQPYMDIMENVNPLPPETISTLQPSTPIQPDTVHHVPVWSFNAVTPNDDSKLERATLWFRQDSLQLEQSRAIYEPVNGQSLIVTTEYTRVGELDMPERIESEGILRYKRRLRSFTLLVKSTAVCDNFSVVRRDTSMSGPFTIETDSTGLRDR